MASKLFKHQGKIGTEGIRSHPHQTDMPPGPDPRLATPSPSRRPPVALRSPCRHADIASAPITALLSRAVLLLFLSSSSCLNSSPLLISSSLFRIAATCAWIWLKELRCVNLGVSGADACCQSVSQSVSQASQSVESSQHRAPCLLSPGLCVYFSKTGRSFFNF